MNRRTVDQAIFALASLISESVPARAARHKGARAELHIDVVDALKTMMDACREAGVAAAREEIRRALRGDR